MQTIYQTMNDGSAIAVHQWLPKKKPKAIIHIVHGMAEHALRYEDFAEDACTRGFTVFAADHRGHGKTCGNVMLKGYLSDNDGFQRVVEDQKEINDEIQKIYPDIPVIILGHSFGSFITQNYIENYAKTVKAAVLVGSAGPNPMINIAGIAAGLNKLFSGRKKPSKFMDKLSFGAYNKTVDSPKTNFDWLSRDEKEVQKYIDDEFCGFVCSVGFYQDMIRGLKETHKSSEMVKIPNDLPILITSGERDPVSNCGKSVKKLYDIYKANGISDLNLKLYEGARHEILNETNKEEVKADIFEWIEKRLH